MSTFSEEGRPGVKKKEKEEKTEKKEKNENYLYFKTRKRIFDLVYFLATCTDYFYTFLIGIR